VLDERDEGGDGAVAEEEDEEKSLFSFNALGQRRNSYTGLVAKSRSAD
jgi:hypothetical protein